MSIIDFGSRLGLALRGKRLSRERSVKPGGTARVGSASFTMFCCVAACLLATGCDGSDDRAVPPLAADTAPMLPGTRGMGESSPAQGKNAGAQQFDTSGGTLAAQDPNGPLLPPVMHTAD